MSNTSLSKEMSLAVKHFNLELRDLEKLTINGMKSAFIPYEERIKIIFDIIKPGFEAVKLGTNPQD
jgi:adenosine deaminase